MVPFANPILTHTPVSANMYVSELPAPLDATVTIVPAGTFNVDKSA